MGQSPFQRVGGSAQVQTVESALAEVDEGEIVCVCEFMCGLVYMHAGMICRYSSIILMVYTLCSF